MEQNNKHLIIAGIAIVVVIALAVAVPHFKHTAVAPTTDSSSVAGTTDVSVTPPVPTTPAGQAAWDAAMKKYPNTVTFAADCTASPITQTLSKGKTLLLVNSSDVAHVVVVGTVSYSIGARHYKTIPLLTAGTLSITCDEHANVANVAVE